MGFDIQCDYRGTCLESEYIKDGQNNSGNFTFKVVGDNSVEIKCKSCGNTIVIYDGHI